LHGSARTRWGAHSTSPDPLAVFGEEKGWGRRCRKRRGEKGRGKDRGKEKKVWGRKGRREISKGKRGKGKEKGKLQRQVVKKPRF